MSSNAENSQNYEGLSLSDLKSLLDPIARKAPSPRPKLLYYLPLARKLEELGSKKACSWALNEIRNNEQIKRITSSYLAIDRWRGDFSLTSLARLIRQIRNRANGGTKLKLLGPSSLEVDQLAASSRFGDSYDSAMENVLAELGSSGVKCLTGGVHLSIHQLAAERGWIVAPVIRAPLENVELRDFERKLNQLVAEIANTGNLSAVSLHFPYKLVPAENELLMRVVGLARVSLPTEVRIGLTTSPCGERFLSQLIPFGLNDLGFVAVDEQSAKQLGIPVRSD